MAYDVASSINELLFEKNSVIVPGFGGFELEQQPANIDHIKSTISPPNKVPSFNKNLTINDGILVNYIQNQNKCTLEQANLIVADFVAEVESKIEKKEIVEFPKVGRIYKDYNKALQFLPYDTNFNVNAFGLPTIEIHPFSRNESVKKETATVAAAALDLTNAPVETTKVKTPSFEAPTSESKPIREEIKVGGIPVGDDKGFKWTQLTMPLLIFASVVLIALSYFILRDNTAETNKGNQLAESLVDNDDKKVNTAPSIEDAEITTLPVDSDSKNDQRLEDDISTGNSISTDIEDPINDPEESSGTSDNATGDKECIVIVGQFGSESNVNRMIQKIETDGYESYEGWSEEKNLKTVGVKFTYSSDSKKERMLRKIRSKYHPNAWVLGE
ncbi:MAG: hypothetical protein AB8F94_11600 [Saprospiraceae bacterium]